MTIMDRTNAILTDVHSWKGTGAYRYGELKIIELLALLIEAVEGEK